MLKFKIVSNRTVLEGLENEKKFVSYALRVRIISTKRCVGPYDRNPADVERRYTHFLDLYNGLKKEHPALLNKFSFPRKTVVGNFEPSLISSRCAAFESLLELIANDSRLRDSPVTIAFLQDVEVQEAKKLISEGLLYQAMQVLETSFLLLNKVYTDRSRVVLSALCRVVACASASQGELAASVEHWAQLALKRYKAVSDIDLLFFYAPLLHACISIWETLGRDKSELVDELNDLRKRGMNVDSVPSLMEAVDSLDSAI